MPYKVYFSPQFNRDLGEIWDYISEEHKDPDLADQITDGLIAESETLEEFPMRGSRVLLPNGMDTGYRFVMFKSYLSLYRIQDEKVYIARAVHEKQDYLRFLIPGFSQKDFLDND